MEENACETLSKISSFCIHLYIRWCSASIHEVFTCKYIHLLTSLRSCWRWI